MKTYDVVFYDGNGINRKILQAPTLIDVAIYMTEIGYGDIISITERI